MSGILGLFRFDGAPVPEAWFESAFARLAHRGTGRSQRLSGAGWRLGHHLFDDGSGRATLQPATDPSGRVLLALDGWIDDKPRLARELGEPSPGSDATLALAAYLEWGDQAFERLVGPWAILVVDGRRDLEVGLARSALGQRGLSYVLSSSGLAVASEPQALLALPGIDSSWDQGQIVRWLAACPLAADRTFFTGISRVPAAHWLHFSTSGRTAKRFWFPERIETRRFACDEEAIELVRTALEHVVEDLLPSRGPVPTLLMSGGLDSPTLAALVARRVDRGLPTVSWVFRDLPTADERRYVQEMGDRFGLAQTWVEGDELGPMTDGFPAADPSSPLESPYRHLITRAYETTRLSGGRVLWGGEYGDHLYARGPAWLRDLAREGRWGFALGSLVAEIRRFGLRRGRARSALGRWVGDRRRGGELRIPAWLTPRAGEILRGELGEPRGWEARALATMIEPSDGAALETCHSTRSGVVVANPWRDRRLVELFLSLPAHLVYRNGTTKWITREAMRSTLPERVRARTWRSSLVALDRRAHLGAARERIERLLLADDACWPEWVSREWLEASYPERLRRLDDGAATAVAWWCLSLERWRRSLTGLGVPPGRFGALGSSG